MSPQPQPTATFKVFRSTFSSWDTLFQEAADFATRIGKERIISISHSADHSDGVVVVWYWANSHPINPTITPKQSPT